MASDPRSRRKSNDEVDASRLKKKLNHGKDLSTFGPRKDVVSGLRRVESGSETLSNRHSTSSPDKGNKNSLSRLSFLESRRKKEKSVIQVTMEAEKVDIRLESNGIKRMKMTARNYKSRFKMHRLVAEATPPPAQCENLSLTRTCTLCSKFKRISYDSPEMELCSCACTVERELDSSYTCKRNPLNKMQSDCQMDGRENICTVCNKDGELMRCEGKDCKRCYHFCCLGSPVADELPGIWYCPQCTNKKLQHGVHSVSEGVESIWGVREVGLSNDKGTQQKQYLVKYHGLAHIHNHWVSEKLLLRENPSLLSTKDQIRRRSVEWTVPHRLLRKRYIMDMSHLASSESNYEWLVKWHGLDYEHASWELGNSYFLSSSVARKLMKYYEIRREKAKKEVDKCTKGSFELSELPASGLIVNDNVLKNVNKLRECWYKSQNAVVFDEQERETTVAFFIRSMAEIRQPFLIIVAPDSLSRWEAELARLAPSVDVVVYSGNSNTRKGIRASEFYEERGRVMLQVLLSSPDIFEDLDMLSCIRWQSVVIEYQLSGISIDLEQIEMLTTNMRLLLISGQIKDTTSEYLNILSLLECDADFNKLRGLKSETNDNLGKLKERLSRFIAYGKTSEVSKFVEYWVPVQLSNYQLEQYCATLISNSTPLCSCSRNDEIRALCDPLPTLRKCCDHPYLVDSSIRQCLIAEGCPAAEIKASGKLELLDIMLTEAKTRGLQVLILFQLILASGGVSIGDILDDFLRHRFGENTYARVHAGLMPSKKQAAVNRFNKKENGQFVLMLDNRACSSTIKLSSLDMIIIYDSDWNPANDLRALQKISFNPTLDQVKVFRLYSSYTVEERALVLAKQNLNLNTNLQSSNRATSVSLLMWGATHLFSKLVDYHAECSSDSNDVLKKASDEFNSILSERHDDKDLSVAISKVKLNVASYSTNTPMIGEAKVQLKDGEEPHVFWRNLLDGRNPKWKHLSGQSPLSRKRGQYMDGSPSKSRVENNDVRKKHKTTVMKNVEPASVQVELEERLVTQVAGSMEGPSRSIPSKSQSSKIDYDTLNHSPNHIPGQSSSVLNVNKCGSEERKSLADEQKSLHNSLRGEITRLCQILNFSEDVIDTMRTFLEYVITNHHINNDSPAILQAFQISVCWIAASISKQTVDKKKSLMQIKDLLNYQCTEEELHSVYSKMRLLKRVYLQSSQNAIDSVRVEDITKDTSNGNEGGYQFPSSKLHTKNMKVEVPFAYREHFGSEIDNEIKKVVRKCEKRMRKLVRKQNEEIKEFNRNWEEKRLGLENDHKVNMALVRTIHGKSSERLKILDDDFAKKMKEHNLLKDVQFKDLKAKHIASGDVEREKAAHWLAEAKACCSSEVRAVGGARSLCSLSDGDAGCPESSTHIEEDQNPSKTICVQGDDVALRHTPLSDGDRVLNETLSVELEKEVPQEVIEIVHNESVDLVRPCELNNDSDEGDAVGSTDTLVTPRDVTDEATAGSLSLMEQQVTQDKKEAHWFDEEKACPFSELRAVGGALSLLSQSEGDAGCSEMSTHVEAQNRSKSVCVKAEDVAQPDASLSGGERVCDETRKVIDIVHNETVDVLRPVEFGNASDIGDEIGGTDTLVNPINGTGEAAGCPPLMGEIVETSLASGDKCVFSPQQVPQDEIHIEDQPDDVAQPDASLSSGVRVPDDISSVELHKKMGKEDREIVTNGNVNTIRPLELNNASYKGDEISSIDTLVNLRERIDELAVGSLALSEQIPTLPEAYPDRCVFTLQQIQQDEIHQTVENPSTSQSEVLEPIGTLPPNPEMQSASLIEKAAHWLEEDKACRSSELRAVGGPLSLLSQSGGDVVCSETSTHAEDQNRNKSACVQDDDVAQPDACLSGGERVCDETRKVEMDKEIHQEVIDIVHNETVDVIRPVELSNASDTVDEIGGTDTLVNPINGTDEAADTLPSLASGDKCVFSPHQVPQDGILIDASLSSGVRVCDDIVTNGNVDTIRPLELDNASDKGDGIGSKDTLVNLGETIDRRVFTPQQIPQEEILRTVENPSTSQSEVPESIGIVTTLPPNPEIQSASQIESTISEHVHVENAVSMEVEPIHQVASWNSQVYVDPLQRASEMICKETEQLQKSCEDMVSKLKTEWKEEVAQLRNKYEKKLQDVEREFRLKKNDLDKIQNKVLSNKRLSEYFRSMCFDPLSSGLPGVLLGIPSSFMPHMHQPSGQHSVRLSPGAYASQPAPWPGSQMARPTVQFLQHQSLQQFTGFYNLSSQNVAAPPVQVVRQAADLFSGTPPSRPHVISAIGRAGSGRDLVGGDIRCAAPHLQSSRSNFPSPPHQLLPPGPQLPSTSQNIPGNHNSSFLPQIRSSFGLSGVQGNSNSLNNGWKYF